MSWQKSGIALNEFVQTFRKLIQAFAKQSIHAADFGELERQNAGNLHKRFNVFRGEPLVDGSCLAVDAEKGGDPCADGAVYPDDSFCAFPQAANSGRIPFRPGGIL